MTLEIEAPAGYQFSQSEIFWRDYFFGLPGASASVSASYRFDGVPGSQQEAWIPRNDDQTLTEHLLKLWSPCASAQTPIRLVITLDATVTGPAGQGKGTGVYTGLALDTYFDEGLVWRRCSAT